MEEIYRVQTHPVCDPGAIVQGEKYRISILTPYLIRLEYNEEGHFEDRATQCVWNRSFPVPQYQIFEGEDSLKILTEGVQLLYDKKRFSANGLSLQVRGNISAYSSIWHYGEETDDLGGTARTLDDANGAIPLEHGLISRNGYAVIDDSKSLLLNEDGWVEPRKGENIDIYFFGYGHRYQKCLKDFYRLTGKTPMLPRYALGNWWSRFHRYDEKEYKELILRFEKEQIPFSVCVVDMDWHLVDIDPVYGSGWTGYTWNKELFPDPAEFMSWLHEHNLKITLNVHPADGVRAFEEPYRAMAEELGRDWEKQEAIDFDITDEKFLHAYFRYLHHPNEEAGVDFWWVDWQQGSATKIPGLDPLWMLNHYHYLDSMRNKKRGLTFSRYAGLGSHRYPVGFSGDTHITWESLDFQPYFTANASNAGYGWWSHDIGGHMYGYKDDELSTRWVQFGVFSPILRLHSSNSRFTGKEPWNYDTVSEQVMKRYLRLRHELIPYLYTMNYLASSQGQPLIRPMYYVEPEQNEAYEVPNEYYFGTELIACPITKPMDKKAKAAPFEAWLPKGVWFDFFNGRVYDGGRKLTLYRGIRDIPVLAKEGAVVPMADLAEYSNSVENPAELRVKVFPGADGSFCMYEDDGSDAYAVTEMRWNYTDGIFEICAVQGNTHAAPERRKYTVEFCGICEAKAAVSVGEEDVQADVSYEDKTHVLTVSVPVTESVNTVRIRFDTKPQIRGNDLKQQIFEALYEAEMEYNVKMRIFDYVEAGKTPLELIGILQTIKLDEGIRGRLLEILLAQTKVF